MPVPSRRNLPALEPRNTFAELDRNIFDKYNRLLLALDRLTADGFNALTNVFGKAAVVGLAFIGLIHLLLKLFK
jgi:hypothetical protein